MIKTVSQVKDKAFLHSNTTELCTQSQNSHEISETLHHQCQRDRDIEYFLKNIYYSLVG